VKSLGVLLALAATATAGPKDSKKPPPKKDPPAPAPAPPAEPPQQPFPTGADTRKIIGILDVRVDGAPAEVGAQFQRDLEAQVDTRRYFLAPRLRMHDRMTSSTKWTEGCVVGDCLREVKVQTGASVVLLASLTGSGTSYGWVVTLVGTESGKVVGQKSERCDVCTVSEALNAATISTVALLEHVPDDLGAATTPVAPVPIAPNEDQLAAVRHGHKVAGVALTIAGLAVAAAGVAFYFANDHDKNGLVVGGGGGGLLLGGIITLTF